MKLSAILAPLIAAGVPGDVILATVKAFEDQQTDALERRRESDRNRQSKRRHNVTSRDVTVTVPSRAGEEGSSSKKDISGKDKKEASPSARGTRIPDDFVPDIEWAVSQGLSLSQAKFEAAQFIDFWRGKPGKDGLKLDWPGTWRMWVRNAIKRSTGPPKKRGYADVAIDKFSGQANGSESVFGNHGDAQRISPGLIESRPDDAHLRGGIGGRFRPSDH